MDYEDYESDFETESTARTSPTKSVTLPYSSPHRCFTQSYGAFYSTIKTPSSTKSENPGEKYLKSSFPNLVEQLGRLHKHRPSKGLIPLPNSEENDKKQKKGKKLSFGEEIRKRNEHQWLRIEDVVKDTMERYDDYCKYLVNKNEVQQKEIQERHQKQKQSLQKMEEKKKEDNIQRSSYTRIWNHHAKMRKLGEQLYQEKVQKEQARMARWRSQKYSTSSWDDVTL